MLDPYQNHGFAAGSTSAGHPHLIVKSILEGRELHRFEVPSRRTYLQSLIASGADLAFAALWNEDLYNCNFQNAKLSGACLRDSRLNEVNLERANLKEADLSFSVWRACCLNGVLLGGARLEGCVISTQDTGGYLGIDFRDAIISNSILLPGDIWKNSKFRNAHFTDMDLRGLGILPEQLATCTFNNVKLTSEEFKALPRANAQYCLENIIVDDESEIMSGQYSGKDLELIRLKEHSEVKYMKVSTLKLGYCVKIASREGFSRMHFRDRGHIFEIDFPRINKYSDEPISKFEQFPNNLFQCTPIDFKQWERRIL